MSKGYSWLSGITSPVVFWGSYGFPGIECLAYFIIISGTFSSQALLLLLSLPFHSSDFGLGFSLFLFVWGLQLGCAQGSFLDPCLGIIPGKAWGIICSATDRTWFKCLQGKPLALCYYLSSFPSAPFYLCLIWDQEARDTDFMDTIVVPNGIGDTIS